MTYLLRIAILSLIVSFGAGCGSGDDDPKVDAAPAIDATFGQLDSGGVCGTTALFEVCGDNNDCASCLCHTYGTAGPLCSKTCDRDEDCEAPSTGCNNMGICKRPQ